jgi:hypothetical protein
VAGFLDWHAESRERERENLMFGLLMLECGIVLQTGRAFGEDKPMCQPASSADPHDVGLV